MANLNEAAAILRTLWPYPEDHARVSQVCNSYHTWVEKGRPTAGAKRVARLLSDLMSDARNGATIAAGWGREDNVRAFHRALEALIPAHTEAIRVESAGPLGPEDEPEACGIM